MASARRLPLDYNVSTYGAVGGGFDYTVEATWEGDTDTDLVTATKGEVLKWTDNGTSFDDAVHLYGATTSADYFRVMMPDTGQGHDGTPNNGVNFYPTVFASGGSINGMSGQCVFIVSEAYSQVQDVIAFAITNTGTYTPAFCANTAAAGPAFVGCIAKQNNPGSGSWGDLAYYMRGASRAIDCLAFESERGFACEASARVYNCTAVDCTVIGFFVASGTPVAINCIADGNTTDWGAYSKTTCLDSTDNVVFVNSAGDDWHLDPTDTAAKGTGTDLSADAVYAFDDDIDGVLFGASWDIGFDKYITPVVAAAIRCSGLLMGVY